MTSTRIAQIEDYEALFENEMTAQGYLLGHSDVSTTMNVYAHSTRKAKRESAKLLDKVAGNA